MVTEWCTWAQASSGSRMGPMWTPQPSGSGPPGRTPPTPVRSWEPSSSCFRGPHSGFRKHGFRGLLGSEIEGSGRDLCPPRTLLRAPRQPLPSLNLDGLGRYRRSSPDVAAHHPAVPPPHCTPCPDCSRLLMGACDFTVVNEYRMSLQWLSLSNYYSACWFLFITVFVYSVNIVSFCLCLS